MPKRQYDRSEYQELASKYRPLLVLYPEIPSHSVRALAIHPRWKAGGPPLTHDYHPRDIRLVLDNAAVLGNQSEPGDWQIMLDKMEAYRRKRIDVVYVVSESGTVRPSELKDASKSIALLPGGSIITPSYF